jgi:hypothetical protein
VLGSVLVSAALIGLVFVSAAGKTPGISPPPPYRSLPPTGGLPEESLTLTGKLVYDNGLYKLEVTALPGYVVTLRFATSDLGTSAAAELGRQVTVSGQWDTVDPTVFVVQSISTS